MGLPEEEREEFIAHHDIPGMTKQELQQALKDRDEAKEKKRKEARKLIDSLAESIKEWPPAPKPLKITH